MTTIDFIRELYCRIADRLAQADKEHKHCQAKLYPSEVVTLAVLYTLKGSGQRAFFRWLSRDYRPLFPHLPGRTRLFRLFNSHRALVEFFLAEASLLGVIDSYGIELLHPQREGAQCKTNRQEGQVQLALDHWWQTLPCPQPSGADCGLGL